VKTTSQHDKDIVARFLEDRARLGRNRAPIFYNDLASTLDFPPVDQFWASHPLCRIFDDLDREDVAQRRPIRTALVVSKQRGLPGEGFYKTLALLRGSSPATKLPQQMQLWSDELDKLVSYYSAQKTKP
jgi:hypothetical protein